VSFEEQAMSKNKHPSQFSHQMEAIMLFLQLAQFENWGI